ncbi:uncharacterized protein NPIL_126091 [Nephila pilipes]|uniref:Uncharacterized protein n=1 Tax=Nephila pilipes TaxID=299642 RepID=A0A8X6MS86_NEPPI|nr:uncharacterized protein NPIL_126091 [Nephila pilipes]
MRWRSFLVKEEVHPETRAMGTRCSIRCSQAACCALGVLVAAITLSAMFWIIWCYLGFSIVQISDTQRRALPNYSYTTSKPSSTSRPTNRSETDVLLETSLNSISRSTVPTVMRGSNRESATLSVSISSQDRKSSILNTGEDKGIQIRRVSTSNTENAAVDKKDIAPTQTYDAGRSDKPVTPPRNENESPTRDQDQIQSSRPIYRDPEFEPDQIPKRPDRLRDRYDDDYDDRRSPSRYDRRDRVRETDNRYSKGDTRVYPDERPRFDDRYLRRDENRKGDDRDRDDRYKDREDRYNDRDDRYRYKDEDRFKDARRYGDDDRYRSDDRYRDDERYRDDDRHRKDDRYRDEDRYKGEERYRKDDRYSDNDRFRDSISTVDKYSPRGDDEDRYSRIRDRDYINPIESSRPVLVPERKNTRSDVREDTRRIPNYDTSTRDRPRSFLRDELPSRSLSTDRYMDRDEEYRRPSRYDDRDRISPTRVRDEPYVANPTVDEPRVREGLYFSRTTLIDGYKRDDSRYSDDQSRSRYYGEDDDRRKGDSRSISLTSDRGIDRDRDGYRSRLQDDRRFEAKYIERADDVVLDRRSYASEEEDEYRRSISRPILYDDRDRRRDEDEYRRSRPEGDYHPIKSRDRHEDRYIDDEDRRPPRRDYETSRRRDSVDVEVRRDLIKDDRPFRSRSDERLPLPPVENYPEINRRYDEESSSRHASTIDRYPDDERRLRDDEPPPKSAIRDHFDASPASRDVVVREKRFQTSRDKPEDHEESIPSERSLNAKDVIEAALRQSDIPEQSPRKVFYPVFDPRVSNLTSPDIIRLSERKGTTITSRRKRSQDLRELNS